MIFVCELMCEEEMKINKAKKIEKERKEDEKFKKIFNCWEV